MRLRQDDYDLVAGALSSIPGVVVTEQADMIATDRTFAPDLIGQVKKTVIDQVDGTAGWSVVLVNQYGVETGVLTETAPQPVPSFSISLDRPIQVAAQAAVDGRTEQAMMVVIEASTGAVLAVAQNEAADKDGPVALMGQYPPGSTFKIITSGAAIANGLATPETMVPCPGRITIGERSVPNYNEFALGTVSMATAFARSCNTTFAKLASEMEPDALTVAAAQFGIGVGHEWWACRRTRDPFRPQRISSSAPRTDSGRAGWSSVRSGWRSPRRRCRAGIPRSRISSRGGRRLWRMRLPRSPPRWSTDCAA